jgi:hypothetical protein
MSQAGTGLALSEAQVAAFTEDGVLALPGFLTAGEIAALIEATDEQLERGEPPFQHAVLRELCWHAGVLAILDQLVGPDYTFHHIHAARHDAGTEGVSWHHDYLQFPQTNRQHAMAHAFFYLNGLNGQVGDLVVLPGSHRSIMRGDAFWFLGTEPLPGERVFDDVPPGTMVVVHSAALHARRPKPAPEGATRYFLDTSYCAAGVQWPGYGGDRGPEMLEVFSAARGPAADHPHLFDPERFFSMLAAWKVESETAGSMVTELGRWEG